MSDPIIGERPGLPTAGTGVSAAGPRPMVATVLLFAANGLAMATYAACLPALRAKLGIDEIGITGMLLAGGLGAIGGMQLSGRLTERYGARRVSLAALPLLVLACTVMGLAALYPLVLVGGMLFGFGNGVLDISMNALAVQVEKARARPVMSAIHATWSLGQLIGSGCVLLLARLLSGGVDLVSVSLLVAAGVLLTALAVATAIVPDIRTPPAVHEDGSHAKVPRVAYLLGIMAISFGLAEGAAIDWSAIHVTDVTRVAPGVGAAGLVAVSGFMLLVRLIGDRLVARIGRRRTVRLGGTLAAIGFAACALFSTFPLVVAGWCVVGFGVGLIAPQVYAAAGHLGGARALAVTLSFGYAAVFIGPAAMGSSIKALGIQPAMWLPAALCAAILVLARAMPRQDSGLAQRD